MACNPLKLAFFASALFFGKSSKLLQASIVFYCSVAVSDIDIPQFV